MKNRVKIILFFYNIFQVALDIIRNDEDPEPRDVEECRKRNYWSKWKKAMHVRRIKIINKTIRFGLVVQKP